MSKLKSILSALEEFNKFYKEEEHLKEIHGIERDLLLSRIRELYETVYLSPQIKVTARHESGEELKTGRTGEKPEHEKQDEILEIEEEKAAEKPQAKKDEPPEDEEKKKTARSRKEPEILAEQYQNKTHYVNESLGATQKKEDLSSKLKLKPIDDIGSALGVNDRFHLIRELFNGDREMFEKTIDYLNNAPNFNVAFSYIQNTFDWDMESEAVQNILDLVRRKFILHQ